MAKKYFGSENPIGQVVRNAGGMDFKVTAVFEDQPENTHLKYTALLSIMTLFERFGSERFNSLEPTAFWN